eukprot:s1579_g33.t1
MAGVGLKTGKLLVLDSQAQCGALEEALQGENANPDFHLRQIEIEKIQFFVVKPKAPILRAGEFKGGVQSTFSTWLQLLEDLSAVKPGFALPPRPLRAMATAGSAGSAGSAQRNLTREEVIAKVLDSLRSVPSDVTRDEVITIVDGMANASGSYDPETCLRLWAERDQVGLVCMLKLSQERFVDLQEKMQEAQAAAQAETQAVREEMAELRALVALQAKETEEEGQAENKDVQTEELTEADQAKITKLEEQLAELERKFTAFEAKEKMEEEGEPKKDEKAKKEPSEEEKKEMEAWGHLEDYDQAFEVLRNEGERNDLTKFKSRSDEISKNHGLGECVTSLIPGLYSDPLKRLGNSVKLNFQPFMKDLPALMDFHKARKPKFDEKVIYVADKTKGKALIPGMKGQARCESKAAFKYTDATGTSWHRLTDIVRATILYDDIQSMYDGLNVLEQLHQDQELEIIEFNDRYQNPMPGNYRDLQLSVRIEEMVCELQLNTKVMAFVKEHAGHRSFEVARELIAAVKESDSRRCDEILQWGTELLGAKSVQEIVNENKKPVLHEAASTGNADLVSVFLHFKADVNLRSSDGQTALHKAMAGGYERAAWALICAGAKFVADNQGVTPLMEGLLKLRVSPADESVARSVSTIAQKCDASEFKHLSEKMEELTQQRLVKSSDLVIACKDGNMEKVDRLLREWADPNSRDSSDELHVVHAALHGGRMDFNPERATVLRKVLEFRANPDATTTLNGETRTALEVALRSSDHRAPAGIAELLKRGARLMNRPVRNWLPPLTAEEFQGAEPRELVRHFVTTWPSFCGKDLMNVEHALMLKGGLLELLLFRGHEAAKQCDALEETKIEVAQHVANLLERCGHHWESGAVRAECRTKDLVLSKTLEDASSTIKSVSCAGQFLAASDDAKVWIYDSDQEFALVKTLEDASDRIFCISWSQNLLLAVGGDDKMIRIYDSAEEFTLIKAIGGATAGVKSLSWCGQFLAAGSVDQKLRVYDAAQNFILASTLVDSSHWICCTCWSGQLLAAAGIDQKIRIYDSSQEFVLLKAFEDGIGSYTVTSLAWGSKLLAAVNWGKEIREIRIYKSEQDFVLSKVLQDASDCIRSLFWSGQLLAAGGDKKVWIYNSTQDFAVVRTLEDASDHIQSIFWSSRFLAVGGSDQKIRIYHQAQDQKRPDAQLADFWATFINLAVHNGAEQGIEALLHAAIACRALTVEQDKDAAAQQKRLQSAAVVVAQKLRVLGWLNAAEEILRSYGVEDFGAIKTLDHASGTILGMSWSPQLLAAGSEDNQIRIYDSTQEFTLLRTLADASDGVLSVCWNQQLLAAAGFDSKVRIYSSEQDFSLLKTLADASEGSYCDLAWNQQLLAAASVTDKTIRVYDSSKDFMLVKTLTEASDSKCITSFASGQQLLAAASRDTGTTIRIYDSSKDFALLKTIVNASGYIYSLAWSQQLLAAAESRTIRVYDSSKDFAVLKSITDATTYIRRLAWGQQLLAAADDTMIRIYDPSQEWALMKTVVMQCEVRSLDWCGQYLGVGMNHGELRVLDSHFQCGALQDSRLWDFAVSKAEQK